MTANEIAYVSIIVGYLTVLGLAFRFRSHTPPALKAVGWVFIPQILVWVGFYTALFIFGPANMGVFAWMSRLGHTLNIATMIVGTTVLAGTWRRRA